MATTQTVRVILSGEDKTGAAVESAKKSLGGITFATKETTQGLNKIGDSFKKIATDSVGLKGPLGNIGEALLSFGTGGVVVTAAVIGVGLIGKAFSALRDMAKDAKDASQELAQAIAEAMGMGAEHRLQAATERYNKAKQDLDDVQARPGFEAAGLTRIDVMKNRATYDRAAAELITATTAVAQKVTGTKPAKPIKPDSPVYDPKDAGRTSFDWSGIEKKEKERADRVERLSNLTEQWKKNAEQLSFDTQLDAFAKSIEPQIDSIVQKMQMENKFDDLRTSIAESLGNSLIDGLQMGMATAIAGGGIGAGFKALTATLLRGLGNAMVQFGSESMKFGALMGLIKKALSSLNPVAGIAAGAALVAAGSALGAVASKMFNGISVATTSGGYTTSYGPNNNPFDSLNVANATTTVTVIGGFLNLTDPRQSKAFSDAISSATGRRLIVQNG